MDGLNFDVENEAHRKIDDYPHRDHPPNQTIN